ncbi:MAG: bifunctional nuclease family protein [Deltaproteobacteria bacterium]|nr:bifunctional nuclease family protein [Deltaproteobacteria bacterium]
MALSTLLLAGALVGSPPIDDASTAPSPAFLEMFVAGVVPTPDGHTMVLVNAEEKVLLPVGIGLPEALSIHGRLEHLRASRPLTHDLLDEVLKRLGGEVVRVQIDDLRDDVFVAQVFVRSGGKVIGFDARPSDAVVLALGARAPIFVARPVVDQAAIHPDDVPRTGRESAGPTPEGQKVLSL